MESDNSGLTALIVVFNHRYDDNLPIIRSIYQDRFSVIRFLVPFYDGTDSDVISCYHNSRYFQGFFATAGRELYNLPVDNLLVIADDMVLNPNIREDNVCLSFQIQVDENLISHLTPLHLRDTWQNYSSATRFSIKIEGMEVADMLPSVAAADSIVTKYGGIPLLADHSLNPPGSRGIAQVGSVFSYPLISGYSDFLVLSRDSFSRFSYLCGIFAALELFVEIGLPTALILSSRRTVRTLCTTPLKYGAIWSKNEIDELCFKYSFSLRQLISSFPADLAFIHPVKMSKWSL